MSGAHSEGAGPKITVELGVKVNGSTQRLVFADWTRVRITRSLHELSGSFELEYDDRYRAQGIAASPDRMQLTRIDPLVPFKVYCDDELLMIGFVEEVDWRVDGQQLHATLRGLDPGGDLLECTANPEGPAEYKGLTLLQIGERLLAPFGYAIRAEVDVGAPIADYALDVGESVFSALDKAAKLRAVLVLSDGLGGIVLTRSGTRRAPAPLSVVKAIAYGMRLSARERYSDYWVKGQARHHAKRGTAPLSATSAHPLPGRGAEGDETSAHARRSVSAAGGEGIAYPLGAGPPIQTVSKARAATITTAGHAVDPAVGRYRPRVWVARTGAGGAPWQVLAEWRMRIARARAEGRTFTVPGWRAGQDARLWRPNEVVEVASRDEDPFDMLIEGVAFEYDERGSRTEISVVGAEAYDLEPLPDEHRRHGGGSRAAKGSSVNKVGGAR